MKVDVLYWGLQITQVVIEASLVPTNSLEQLQGLIDEELNVVQVGHQFIPVFITMLPNDVQVGLDVY